MKYMKEKEILVLAKYNILIIIYYNDIIEHIIISIILKVLGS